MQGGRTVPYHFVGDDDDKFRLDFSYKGPVRVKELWTTIQRVIPRTFQLRKSNACKQNYRFLNPNRDDCSMPTRNELEKMFRGLKIDFRKPGFYDTPQFQAVEREHPAFLKSYADFIQNLTLSAKYVDRARQIVRDTAEFLFNELVADGRKGACVDISGLVLRGFWSVRGFGVMSSSAA